MIQCDLVSEPIHMHDMAETCKTEVAHVAQ
jgi:hypothetical protein